MIPKLRTAFYRSRTERATRQDSSRATRYIWSLGYSLLCDITPISGKLPQNYATGGDNPAMRPPNYCFPVHDGDIIWVASWQLASFASKVLPKIRGRFSLVVSDGDDSFPSALGKSLDVKKIIEDPRILSIFAQNLDGSYDSDKLFNLPIGLDFHSINHTGGYWGEAQKNAQEQEEELDEIVANLAPTDQRIPKAFVDFHLSDRLTYDGTRRSDIFRAIDNPDIIDVASGQLPRKELWKTKGRYAFSISPHGNGLDCHRTWEDLVLGCIVIVKTSSLDPLYEGLPVAIVKDWKEITPPALKAWRARFGNALADTEGRKRLTLEWWMDKVRRVTRDRAI